MQSLLMPSNSKMGAPSSWEGDGQLELVIYEEAREQSHGNSYQLHVSESTQVLLRAFARVPSFTSPPASPTSGTLRTLSGPSANFQNQEGNFCARPFGRDEPNSSSDALEAAWPDQTDDLASYHDQPLPFGVAPTVDADDDDVSPMDDEAGVHPADDTDGAAFSFLVETLQHPQPRSDKGAGAKAKEEAPAAGRPRRTSPPYKPAAELGLVTQTATSIEQAIIQASARVNADVFPACDAAGKCFPKSSRPGAVDQPTPYFLSAAMPVRGAAIRPTLVAVAAAQPTKRGPGGSQEGRKNWKEWQKDVLLKAYYREGKPKKGLPALYLDAPQIQKLSQAVQMSKKQVQHFLHNHRKLLARQVGDEQ
jgi:hypothetical protein